MVWYFEEGGCSFLSLSVPVDGWMMPSGVRSTGTGSAGAGAGASATHLKTGARCCTAMLCCAVLVVRASMAVVSPLSSRSSLRFALR